MPTTAAEQTTPLTTEERYELGRAARREVARSAHAAWERPSDRPDPVALLQGQDDHRIPELVPIRYGRMARSPWTFLRGAAAVMAQDLACGPRTSLGVQLCGDAHLSNFGLFSSPDRRLLFDINDFDETFPGPFEWDVKRLAASVVVAARDNGHRERDAREAVGEAMAGYRETVARLARASTLDAWYFRVEFADVLERVRARSAIHRVATAAQDGARRRTSLRAFNKLTEVRDGRRRIVANPPLVVPLPDDAAEEQIRLLRELLLDYRSSLPSSSRAVLAGFKVADIARKVVGVGSVGTRAFIVLLLDGDGAPLLLQVKQASASVLEAHTGHDDSVAHGGRRVVEGQQLIQGTSDIFLGWTRVEAPEGTVDFYVRQLWDGKGSVAIETLDAEGLASYARLCGAVLARAHSRSGDAAALAGYLGDSRRFDRAITDFAVAYADQTVLDHQALLQAIADGRVEARTDL